jgi:hypothetical protein
MGKEAAQQLSQLEQVQEDPRSVHDREHLSDSIYLTKFYSFIVAKASF